MQYLFISVLAIIIKMSNYYQFHLPFTLILSASSFSGKSYLIRDLLNNHRHLFSDKFKKIYYCYSEENSVNERIRDAIYVRGLPKDYVLSNPSGEHTLIIIDDMMNELNEDVANLFTKNCHHSNISVILMVQNLFHQGKYSRAIALNTRYLIVFKPVRDRSQIYCLCRQLMPSKSKILLNTFNEIFSKPYSYVLMDFTQNCPDSLRFRTDITQNKSFCTVLH